MCRVTTVTTTTSTITTATATSGIASIKSNFSNNIIAATNITSSTSITLMNPPFYIKPLNLQGGQCSWCGKYGHLFKSCALLK